MFRAIALSVLLPVNVCSADDMSIARAFATFDREDLIQFLSTKTRSEITQYRAYGGFNVVHSAMINSQNPDALKLALEYGADINQESLEGRTPLRQSIEANKLEVAQRLISFGASLDVLNIVNQSAISICQEILVQEPNQETCKFVLSLKISK